MLLPGPAPAFRPSPAGIQLVQLDNRIDLGAIDREGEYVADTLAQCRIHQTQSTPLHVVGDINREAHFLLQHAYGGMRATVIIVTIFAPRVMNEDSRDALQDSAQSINK